jgi:hypothetical protein
LAKAQPSLPLSIHLVPLCITLDKIHAQQTPASFGLGFGFDEVGEIFKEVDEPREQRKFHRWPVFDKFEHF